ncbi:MAG: response regulator [Spirochaetales bacterium]|nr:response regulator [Spirochaetales bacterium]
MSDKSVSRGMKPDGTPFKVLLVDDSMFVTKQLSRILEAEGFEILSTASHGREGVEKYLAYHPEVDLVTMDITMPGMDGVSALEKIIDFDSSANVIMLTALGNKDLIKRAILSGAEAYLTKPLDSEKVLGCVSNVLQRKFN